MRPNTPDPEEIPESLARKRAIMKLPMAERRRILEEQAEKVADEYNKALEDTEDLQGGDIIEDY